MSLRGAAREQDGAVAAAAEHAALVALATGGWRQALLAVTAWLDLWAMLGARSADLEEVCYSLGTQRQPTQLLLAACAGLGLVVERDAEYRLAGLGRALLATRGASLAAWADASTDRRAADALYAALRDGAPARGGHGLDGAAGTALGWPLAMAGADAATGARAHAALRGLHDPAALALAAALAVPPGGLVVEVGGQGLYARALSARGERLRGALIDVAPWALQTADLATELEAGVLRVFASLGALGGEPAAAVVLAQVLETLPLGALRAQLASLPAYLGRSAPLVAVGPFRGGAHGRPLAPLLALVEFAAGGPGSCPTAEQVAGVMRASGLEVTDVVVLPEPNVAVVGRAAAMRALASLPPVAG